MDSSVINLCRQLQSLAKVFRFVELCILLAFLSWLSTHLPFAVRISGEYFRKLISLIFCPISIFLLGNAIVVTLLAKSGLFSGEYSPSIDNAVAELYEEFRSEDPEENPVSLKEEVIFQDKEIICEENIKSMNSSSEAIVVEEKNEKVVIPDEVEMERKASYGRSKSEKLRRESGNDEEKKEKLRRSETEICWRSFAGDEESEVVEDDGMSSEEFRRTIEAFIAKQMRFHREERLSVVLHGQA
ncbi:adenylate kinase [Bienertia sinuspersici]